MPFPGNRSRFPQAVIQQCIIYQIQNTPKLVSYKNLKPLMANLRRVYAASTEEIALAELDALMKNGAANIPSEYSDSKWTKVRSKSTAVKCLIGACHYLNILNNIKSRATLWCKADLTLLRILSKVDKPNNAGIHIRNVGTRFSRITVL